MCRARRPARDEERGLGGRHRRRKRWGTMHVIRTLLEPGMYAAAFSWWALQISKACTVGHVSFHRMENVFAEYLTPAIKAFLSTTYFRLFSCPRNGDVVFGLTLHRRRCVRRAAVPPAPVRRPQLRPV